MERALSVHNTIGAGSTGSHNRKHQAGLFAGGVWLLQADADPYQQTSITTGNDLMAKSKSPSGIIPLIWQVYAA